MKEYDVIIVGGGPAGSTCARFLAEAGVRAVILDKAKFPRVKLCAGWVNPPIWDILELDPARYPKGLWGFNRVHFHYGKYSYDIKDAPGYFIRRYEFDEYLIQISNTPLFEHQVKELRREYGHWIVDGEYRARYLVGAGGTHCPVAKALFPRRFGRPYSTVEKEFKHDQAEIMKAMAGRDGEPELIIHRALDGYSWNVPKTDWINVGTGTLASKALMKRWEETLSLYRNAGHLPETSLPKMEKMTGHVYYGFDPRRLACCHDDGAFLVGDSLGLANPLTGEGIMAGVLSGKLCAGAIAAGLPEQYRERLSRHPIIKSYGNYRRLMNVLLSLNRITPILSSNYLSGRLLAEPFKRCFVSSYQEPGRNSSPRWT